MTDTKIHLTVHQGLPGFKELEFDWNDLAMQSGTHFIHYPAWYGAKLQNSSDENVYFIALRDVQNTLFAVLPLQWTTIKIKFLRIPVIQLYYPDETGVNDVLARASLLPYRKTIFRTLRKTVPYFLFMRWQCTPRNGNAVSLDFNKSFRHTHNSKYLQFSKGFTDFIGRYSSKFRKDILKKMCKIEEKGKLELKIFQDENDLDTAFEQFLHVEDSGWKGNDGTSILKQPLKLEYYKNIMGLFKNLGLFRINLLTLDGKTIAAQFGIVIKKQLYLLKIGFCEDFSKYSPGFLIIYKLIEHYCQEKSIDTVSFVTGVRWMDRWHPEAVDLGIFYSSKCTLLSSIIVHVIGIVIKIREAVTFKK